jgi:hypothetical protein
MLLAACVATPRFSALLVLLLFNLPMAGARQCVLLCTHVLQDFVVHLKLRYIVFSKQSSNTLSMPTVVMTVGTAVDPGSGVNGVKPR